MSKPRPRSIDVEIYDQKYSIVLKSAISEAEFRELADLVDTRMREIAAVASTPDSLKIAVLTALHLAQEQEGHLSASALEYVGSLLDLTVAQVHDTASFYTMFRFKPEGKTLLEFCTTLSCALGGAEAERAPAAVPLGGLQRRREPRVRQPPAPLLEPRREVQAEQAFEVGRDLQGPPQEPEAGGAQLRGGADRASRRRPASLRVRGPVELRPARSPRPA